MRVAAGETDRDVPGLRRQIDIGHRFGLQHDTKLARAGEQRSQQRAVLHHVGERLVGLDLAVEGEKDRPHRIGEPAVGHHHVENGLRTGRDRVPDPDHGQQPPRRRHDGGGARIGRRAGERRVGDRDRKSRPQPLPQRDRERESGHAGTADQDIDPFACVT